MKHQCGLSCRPPEPWSLPGAEQPQCCHAALTSEVSRLLWQWKRTAKNCHRKSSSKVFDSWRSTRHLQDASFSAQERLDGRKRYALSPHCLFRETTFHASDKHDYRNSLERSYYCHRYQVTKHVLLSTYANFSLFAFLLKLFSVLKVSKSTILFQ